MWALLGTAAAKWARKPTPPAGFCRRASGLRQQLAARVTSLRAPTPLGCHQFQFGCHQFRSFTSNLTNTSGQEESSQISIVERQINGVEQSICEVAEQLAHIDLHLREGHCNNAHCFLAPALIPPQKERKRLQKRKRRLQTKEQQLRTKEQQLRTKEQQLRTKEQQLRDERQRKEHQLSLSRESLRAQAPKPRFLTAADFVPIAKLPKIDPLGKDVFVPSTWIAEKVAHILPEINRDDREANRRVAPAAILACSRGGKTRPLKEIGRHLQNEGHPVIFITFNDNTSVTFQEKSVFSPLQSLLSRIAYSIVDSEKADQISSLHDSKGFPQLVTSEPELIKWLGSSGCVLLIDEINHVVNPDVDPIAKEMAEFLKMNFLKTKGRYFFFTSHFRTVSAKLSKLIAWPSDRNVLVISPPRFGGLKDSEEILKGFNIHPLIFGLAPSIAVTYRDEEEILVKRVKEAQILTDDACLREILRDLFIPNDEFVLGDLFSYWDRGDRVWIPLFLKHIFGLFASMVTTPLEDLGKPKTDSGEGFEQIVVCALWLRTLAIVHNPGDARLKSPLIPPLVPSPSTAKVHVCYPRARISHEDLIQQINGKSPLAPSVEIIYPQWASHDKYDLYLAFYSSASLPTIYGYQARGGDLPSAVPSGCAQSFVLRSRDVDAGQSAAAKMGWSVLSQKARDDFLGPTFAALVKVGSETWRKPDE